MYKKNEQKSKILMLTYKRTVITFILHYCLFVYIQTNNHKIILLGQY